MLCTVPLASAGVARLQQWVLLKVRGHMFQEPHTGSGVKCMSEACGAWGRIRSLPVCQ